MFNKEIEVDGPYGSKIIGRPSSKNIFNQTLEITTNQGTIFEKSKWDGKWYEKK